MNNVSLIGRLTRDPELKFTTGTGIAVTTFTLAVDKNYVGQDGQRKADFIQIICWRNLAELVANNLSKGRLVGITGRIETSKYESNGVTKYKTSVVAGGVKFLDYKKDSNVNNDNFDEGAAADAGFVPVEDDDTIPF